MKYKVLLLLLAVTPFIYSQNQLTGIVKDASTTEPVFSANVYFPALEKGAVTDFDGKFTIKNVPAGTYKLVISSIGYSSITKNVSLPSEDVLEIELNASAVEMEEVIVSTPFHQLQSENVMKVERESVSELERKGAVTLSEGITQMPGVESITTGVGIGKPVIRGLSANRVLVYTQGVRLENQQFGDEHGLGISSKGISSIEVIKGPASLLYGSDAIGGVLYLNPESYAEAGATHAEASADYFSNTLGCQGSAMAETSGEHWKFLARGSYAAHSDYETGNGSRVTNTRFNEKDLKTGIGYQANKYKGDFRYNFNDSEIGIPEEIGLQNTDKGMILPYQNVKNHILSLDNHIYFANSSLDAKFGYQMNNRREFENSNDPALEMQLNTFNYNVKYNLPELGKFETIAGIQGMFQENTNSGEEILIPDAQIVDFGVFATSHYELERWDFQGGLRFDNRSIETAKSNEADLFKVNRDFQSLNAALGAKYDITSAFTARLNFATGFRAPNLAELTSNGVHEGANRYEIGNPDLKNEQNFQSDLALEWRSQHFELFANAFNNSVNDYIYISPTGETRDGNIVYDYVQSDARLYGGEIGFHLHPHPLDWLHLESSFETVTGKQDNGNYLPLIPANSINTSFRVEQEKGNLLKNKFAFVSMKNVFNKEEISVFETPTDGYTLFGAGLGADISLGKNDLSLSISGNNLFDKTYISHLSRLKTDGIPNIGRNIKFSAVWSL